MPQTSDPVPSPIRSVLVTGGSGNLGGKLVRHLIAAPWCQAIVSLDVPGQEAPEAGHPKVTAVAVDLADPADTRWREALAGVDAVVHLAAQNPYPDAPWPDAAASMDMTLNLLAAAQATGLRRFVFASSNHVMGQYKDEPLAGTIGPGRLTPELAPGPGTRWFDGQRMVQGVAYGVSKLVGERACVAAAAATGGRLTAVAVRIGWCQPGENRPETLNAAGLPGAPPRTDPDAERDLRWFRGMWLSNRDYAHLMERALVAAPDGWPAPGIVVNGMSANGGMAWSLEATRRHLGYAPQDDIAREPA
ncbi:NAD-dependent epimerase/dehydratase family protein [Salinarimonas soli]|uniref:NAD-dependent epimerase/dehydratase family protein n=1 Tax=Salinarimonas soli TaxID=1638099 RepID=UPI001AEE66F4|nr:NAD(P)-dependent oxidoreductase [Salinarimonas soli]